MPTGSIEAYSHGNHSDNASIRNGYGWQEKCILPNDKRDNRGEYFGHFGSMGKNAAPRLAIEQN